MRLFLYVLTITPFLVADCGLAQDRVHWVQSTNRADSSLIEEISRKLYEPSPINGLVQAMPINQLMSMYPITILLDKRALVCRRCGVAEKSFVDVDGL